VLEDTLLDYAEIWPNEESAVECRDWRREVEWFDQHLHPSWRPSTRYSEGDAGVAHFVHSGLRALRQDLVVRDERPIDIGQKKFDRHNFAHKCTLVVAPLSIIPRYPCVDHITESAPLKNHAPRNPNINPMRGLSSANQKDKAKPESGKRA
jgi:hypothetical protein